MSKSIRTIAGPVVALRVTAKPDSSSGLLEMVVSKGLRVNGKKAHFSEAYPRGGTFVFKDSAELFCEVLPSTVGRQGHSIAVQAGLLPHGERAPGSIRSIDTFKTYVVVCKEPCVMGDWTFTTDTYTVLARPDKLSGQLAKILPVIGVNERDIPGVSAYLTIMARRVSAN